MKRRLLSTFLAVCLVLSLLPMSAFAADSPTVKIGGFSLVEGHYYTSDGSSVADYGTDAPSDDTGYARLQGDTLTLNNFVYTSPEGPSVNTAIEISGDCTIWMEGTSTVTSGNAASQSKAIVGSALTFNGTGSLECIGGTATKSHVCGIRASTVTLLGGTLTAKAINAPRGYSTGIWTNSDVTVSGGVLNAVGGNGRASSRYGMVIGLGDDATTHVTVLEGGELNVSGPTGGIYGTSSPNCQVIALGTLNGPVIAGNQLRQDADGNWTMKGSVTVPEGQTLTIDKDKTLTVPADGTLTNNGTIEVAEGATLVNNGAVAIEAGGELIVAEGGTLTNNGTLTIPEGVGYTINYASETAFAATGYEVSTDKSTWNTGSINITPGGKLYVRYSTVGTPVENTLPSRPAAPALTLSNETEGVTVPADCLYGTTDDQYSNITTQGTGAAVTVAPETSLYVCLAATDSAFKSAVQTITAPAQAEAPSVSIDYSAETLNTTAAMEYKVGTADWTACTDTMAATDFGWDGTAEVTVQFRTAATDANYPSEPQTALTIPARPAAPELGSATSTRIRLETVAPNEDGVEPQYQINGRGWQDSPIFTGLDSDTEYTFAVRYNGVSFTSETAVFKTREHHGDTVTPATKPTPEPTPEPTPGTSVFVDVPSDTWYADAVDWAVKNGITNGTSATTFSPNATCTRAQIVQFLYNQAEKPEVTPTDCFSDVPANEWYAKAVTWAVEGAVTNGMDDTHFAPNAPCTRAQVVQFLYNVAGCPEVTLSDKFEDVSADAWYAKAISWALENKITSGTSDTTFSPNATCTRAQIVQFLYNQSVNS